MVRNSAIRLAVIGSTGLVGSQVVAHAEAYPHAVTGISKESGVDPLIGTGVEDGLAGVETIVNVIQSPNLARQSVSTSHDSAIDVHDVTGHPARAVGEQVHDGIRNVGCGANSPEWLEGVESVQRLLDLVARDKAFV